MNKYTSSTLLINALFTEISEMQKMIQSTPNTSKVTIEGISIPVNVEVSELTGGDTRKASRPQLKTIIDSLNHDCTSLQCTLGVALRIAYETTQIDTDAHVYGMIWASNENNNFRLNVLHPIVVNSIINKEYEALIKMESEGTLYVYEYKKKPTYKVHTEQAESTIDRWVEILSVLNTEAYNPNTTLSCSTNMQSLCQDIRRGSTTIENAQVAFSESGSNPRKVITPTMFITLGMLFPYYGAIQSRQSGGYYESRDLMPFGSCNLNHSSNIYAYGGTCTGNLSNSVYASLRVLTNLNTGSPHHLDVIAYDTDVRTYVRTTQEVSASILYEAFKEEWQPVEEVVESTPSTSEDSTSASKGPEGSEELVHEELSTTIVEPVVVVKRRGRPSKASLADAAGGL